MAAARSHRRHRIGRPKAKVRVWLWDGVCQCDGEEFNQAVGSGLGAWDMSYVRLHAGPPFIA